MDLAASIQDRLRGLFPDLLGIELTEVAPERVAARLTVRDELCTTGKALHGGAIMAFADTLGAVGTFVNLPQGARTTTIESKTNFLGAVHSGTVIATATPLHAGGTTIVVETSVRDAAGRLVAKVTQTQMVLRPRN